jgi:vancomycin resistance protein VanJ
MPEGGPAVHHRTGRRGLGPVKSATWTVSLLLWAFAVISFWLRPDSLALATMLPAWIYFVTGLVLATLSASRRARARSAAAFLAWVVFLVLSVDQTGPILSLRRWPSAQWEAARKEGRALRVVSLNCAGGDVAAAAEPFAREPDIILFQESPPEEALRKLVANLGGDEWSLIYGHDASIAVHGKALPVSLPPDVSRFATRSLVTTDSGIEVDVTSVRLLPPVFCFNLLSPGCWRSQRHNRMARSKQVESLQHALAASETERPVIAGGDFNAPAGDGAMRSLRSTLRDTFRQAGVGWGDTATNDIPLLRVDQVYVSDDLRGVAVVAKKTEHSDHRMVICDLVLTDPRRQAPR